MRTAAMYEASPSRVLARLNAALVVDPDRRQICTAVVRADRRRAEDGTVRVAIACGGHPPPFLSRHGGGAEAVGAPGPLLGAFDERHAGRGDLGALGAGDALVLYTDGVTDARGGRRAASASERLAAAARRAPRPRRRRDRRSRSTTRCEAFEHGQQRDDVALLVLRAVTAAPAARKSAHPVRPFTPH